MSDATIRAATPEDAPELARLRWEWRAGMGRPLEMDERGFRTAAERWIVDHIDSHPPFVAAIDEEIVGIGWLALVDRVPGPDQWARRSAMVQSVYVTPERRGAGIGAAIVQALVDEARRAGCGYLTLHPSELSRPMYRRLGFREWDGVLELDVLDDRMPTA